MRVIFWQNIPSIHQSALIRDLSLCDGIEVILATEQTLPESRINLGWADSDFGHALCVRSNDEATRRKLCSMDDNDSVHIFSGYHTFPHAWSAYRELRASRALLGAYSEDFNPFDWKGKLRGLRGRFCTVRDAGRLDFMLAIGETAMNWFQRVGISEPKIFPFAYFTEKTDPSFISEANDEDVFRITFIGQLNSGKGVDLLLEALSNFREASFELVLVGDGPQRMQLENLSSELGIERQVRFVGAVPNRSIHEYLAVTDLHVLPSRYDGWGAVVNEALMSGVPSIASDACGASCLLHSVERGGVFPRLDVTALSSLISLRLSEGKLNNEKRKKLVAWSASLGGEAAAGYLLAIVSYLRDGTKGTKPLAPWST